MIDPLISHYLDWLAKRRRSPRTIDLRRKVLTRMDRELPHGLVAANASEIERWIYRPNWSKKTLSVYHGCAVAFFSYACGPSSPEFVDHNPMTVITPPDTPRGLPRPVSEEHLAAIVTRSSNPYRLWALLAAYAGLRCCEIASLHREHVTEQELTVVSGKGDKPAILPTHSTVWEAVRDLPPGPVARTVTGVPATAHYVSIRAAVYFRDELGLRVTMHQLRHRFGTEIYRRTKDLRKTQELMRHANPSTTARYTEICSEERRAAIQALPTFTGP